MALHVRGVLLPDDEVRDLWLVGDRITLEPVAGAETVSDGGYVVPGLVDAHCHLGIQYGATPIESLDQARELAHTDRDAGVLALRDEALPFEHHGPDAYLQHVREQQHGIGDDEQRYMAGMSWAPG